MTNHTATELLRQADLTLGFAGMIDGRTRAAKALTARGRALQSAAFDAAGHPVSAEAEAMTDAELLAALKE